MYKQYLCALALSFLVACSSTENNSEEVKEQIYQKTGNHAKLISLYHARLEEQDTEATRKNLIKSYIAQNDYNSAQFYLKPLLTKKQKDPDIWLFHAQSLAGIGRYQEAVDAAEHTLGLDKSKADAAILLGNLHGYSYDFDIAREYFEQARENFGDQISIQNNIAVLFIAEGEYQQAASQLIPIYQRGQADEKVMANLVLAMAKLGNFEFVKQVLQGKYNQYQIENIYHALRAHQPITTA